MQKEMFEDRPPITRVRSKKVSCETLFLSNVDSKRLCDAHIVYCSDDEKHDRKIEADSHACEGIHAETDFKLTNGPSFRHENLENSSYRQGRLDKPFPAIVRPRRALAHFLLKTLPCKCAMSDAGSSGRKGKPLRTLHSAAHRSGPIILPIGSHSGHLNNMNSKAPVLLKASSIIPSNAISGKMNALVIRDPSSPKVTCLGRVRIKQQGRNNTGKPTPVVLHDGNTNEMLPACWMIKLKCREKRADVKVSASTSTHHKRRERLDSSGNMSVAGYCIDRSKRSGSGNTTNGSEMAKLTTKELEGKATLASRCVTKEESKRWSQVHMANHDEQKPQTQEVSPLAASSPEAEVCINLSRFGYVESQQHCEINATSSLVTDRSQRFENTRQAPPHDALLLMRNSRPKEDGHNTHIVQAPPQKALLLMRSSKPKGSFMESISSPGLLNALETSPPAGSSDHVIHNLVSNVVQLACDELASLTGAKIKELDSFSNMQEPLSMASCIDEPRNRLFSQMKKSAIDRRVSLPNAEVSLWQRRAIHKPNDLEIGRLD